MGADRSCNSGTAFERVGASTVEPTRKGPQLITHREEDGDAAVRRERGFHQARSLRRDRLAFGGLLLVPLHQPLLDVLHHIWRRRKSGGDTDSLDAVESAKG